MHMFRLFGEAARWEVDPGYVVLMMISYQFLILFYILALFSMVSLIIVAVKKDPLNSRRSRFARILIAITSLVSVFLALFVQVNFYFPTSNTIVPYLLFILSIVSAAIIVALYNLLFKKKVILFIVFFTIVITTSVICLPAAIENFQILHEDPVSSPCNDFKYVNGKELPDCPV